jgi:hypothetical protein
MVPSRQRALKITGTTFAGCGLIRAGTVGVGTCHGAGAGGAAVGAAGAFVAGAGAFAARAGAVEGARAGGVAVVAGDLVGGSGAALTERPVLTEVVEVAPDAALVAGESVGFRVLPPVPITTEAATVPRTTKATAPPPIHANHRWLRPHSPLNRRACLAISVGDRDVLQLGPVLHLDGHLVADVKQPVGVPVDHGIRVAQ